MVALDDESDALSVMTAIARMQEGEGQAIASCLVLSEHQGLLVSRKPAGRPHDLGRSWTIRGGIDADPDLYDLFARRADELAERIHDTYRARFGAPAPQVTVPSPIVTESSPRRSRSRPPSNGVACP